MPSGFMEDQGLFSARTGSVQAAIPENLRVATFCSAPPGAPFDSLRSLMASH